MDFDGPLYRALNPVYANAPLSGEGARRFGGRFNRLGVPALYLTPDFEVLRLEIARGGRFQPSVVVEVAAELRGLFDARDPTALTAEGLRPVDIADPEWRLAQREGQPVASQTLAAGLVARGYLGLVAPSFALGAGPGHRAIVLWRWEGEDVRLRVIDEDGRLGRFGPGPARRS